MKVSDNSDKAGVKYWDKTERNSTNFDQVFGPLPGVRGFGRRAWHKWFKQVLLPLAHPDAELLELGCGGSAFLPYFSRNLGFKVSGIDYSKGGVELASDLCLRYNVSPELHCADIFNPPAKCLGRYDVVVSFGLVEHFTDTTNTIRSFMEFLRPGGKLLTVAPNMQGISGFAQKHIAPDIYAIHEVIDIERFRIAHENAGLELEFCDYFLFNNFGVVNPGINPGRSVIFTFAILRALTALTWSIESVAGALPANRWTSPYVISLATKPSIISSLAK
jgi:2-polyprenyl-3-methyl-5-hydroxy-6-metoxy-1,4-benzoquinol methylase